MKSMSKSRGFLFAAIGVLALGEQAFSQTAQSDLGSLDCNSGILSVEGCLLSVAPGAQYGAVRAIDAASGTRRDATYTPLDQAGESLTLRRQFIILIDDSTAARSDAALRRQTMPQIKSAVAGLAGTLSEMNVEVAVFAYDLALEELAGFGASRQEIVSSLNALEYDGINTRTFGALNEAINILADRDALSRSVVLFTDGLAEDSGSAESVIEAAQEKGVSVSVFISHWNAPSDSERAEVETRFGLASDRTGGVFSANDRRSGASYDGGFLAKIRQMDSESGVITVPNRTGQIAIEVDLLPGAGRDAETITATLGEAQPPTSATDETGETGEEPAKPLEIWEEKWFLPAAAGGLLLLLLVLFFVFRRKKPAEEEFDEDLTPFPNLSGDANDGPTGDDVADDEDETRMTPSGMGPLLAKLELVSTGAVMEIRDRKFSVGRSEKNEVVLKDDSISRIHCEFHQTRDGNFAVTDLQSLNKTRVNGEEISTQVLQDGDIVRLGEVDLRYRIVNA